MQDTVIKDNIEFDVSKLTAADMLLVKKGDLTGNVDLHADVFAKVCTSCPSAWGKPGEVKTFSELFWPEFSEATDVFKTATNHAYENTADTIAGVKFDFSKIKARDMGQFLRAAQIGDVQTVAQMFTQFVKATPTGKLPEDADGYLALPFYSVFLPMTKQAVDEANDREKNKSRRS